MLTYTMSSVLFNNTNTQNICYCSIIAKPKGKNARILQTKEKTTKELGAEKAIGATIVGMIISLIIKLRIVLTLVLHPSQIYTIIPSKNCYFLPNY